MIVQGTGSTAYVTQNQKSGSASNELGKDEFLKLLILQLQNQDPLNPIKNEEFIAQLAQFSSLEQMQNLNKSMTSLGSLQILTQTASLVGKEVEVLTDNNSVVTGTVTQAIFKDGTAKIQVNVSGTQVTVTVDRIVSIK
jgi:flagellar basal-body rod modification protein FlgD